MGFQTPLYELSDYLAVDIHHIFPQKWCIDNNIDDERRDSVVNKTPLSAVTNRTIGGVAPVKYLAVIENTANIDSAILDRLLRTHLVDPEAMRSTDFDAHFVRRREALVRLVETAMGKAVQRDVQTGDLQETPDHFDAADTAVVPDEED